MTDMEARAKALECAILYFPDVAYTSDEFEKTVIAFVRFILTGTFDE